MQGATGQNQHERRRQLTVFLPTAPVFKNFLIQCHRFRQRSPSRASTGRAKQSHKGISEISNSSDERHAPGLMFKSAGHLSEYDTMLESFFEGNC